MLVRIGCERYIIPTLSIVEAVRPEHDSITSLVNRGEMITIRDNIIPLFRLGALFSIADARQDPAEGIVIVVEDSGKMAGILVDELLGQQSIVIKSMGATMKGLPGVSGGSILSDGRVGIIIDVAGIVKLAMSGNLAGR
jgi:two-component system chemotaxis sensor kinase CheA